MVYMPTRLQVRQDEMACYVLLRLRYAIRPISNHAEVRQLSVILHQPPNHAPRVYAVTGKNRWIAFCLCFMSFAQAGFGIAGSIYVTPRPGTISLPPL